MAKIVKCVVYARYKQQRKSEYAMTKKADRRHQDDLGNFKRVPDNGLYRFLGYRIQDAEIIGSPV